MTLEKTVRQKLSKWSHPGGRQHCIVPDEGAGWTMTLAADRCDELGCLIWELTVQHSAGAIATDAAGLRARAERVAARATGLLEPLRVVEVDAPRLQAQLRSQSPSQRDEQNFYYEVLLTASGSGTVRRYQAAQGKEHRTQVLFALTHEALAKLAADLTAEK